MAGIERKIRVDEDDIEERFIRSSGPAAERQQVATAVSFASTFATPVPAEGCGTADPACREAGDGEGVLIIEPSRSGRANGTVRTRGTAWSSAGKSRRAVTPEGRPGRRGIEERRLEGKQLRSETKRVRKPVSPSDD